MALIIEAAYDSIVKQSIIKLVDDCFVSNHMTRSKSKALVRHIPSDCQCSFPHSSEKAGLLIGVCLDTNEV